jgi:hypothetical protein
MPESRGVVFRSLSSGSLNVRQRIGTPFRVSRVVQFVFIALRGGDYRN